MFASVFGRVVWLIALGASAAGLMILFGFLGTWIPAADSFAHFRFHLAVAVAGAAIFLAVSRRWKTAGFAAVCAAIGVAGMEPALPSWGAAVAAPAPRPVKLVQLNLLFRNDQPEAVAEFIRREDADIVTLQEVSRRSGRVIELLSEEYPYRLRCRFSGVGGVAVLSRLPRAPGREEGCVEGKGMAWIRVMADGRPVSVTSLHLHWPWPFRQPKQLDELERNMASIPRPVLLAGDFNAAPWSHAAKRVAAATDTQIAPGLRFSYDIRLNPRMPALPVPIDHLLLPPEAMLGDIRLAQGPGSDHRSLVASLSFPPDAEAGSAPR